MSSSLEARGKLILKDILSKEAMDVMQGRVPIRVVPQDHYLVTRFSLLQRSFLYLGVLSVDIPTNSWHLRQKLKHRESEENYFNKPFLIIREPSVISFGFQIKSFLSPNSRNYLTGRKDDGIEHVMEEKSKGTLFYKMVGVFFRA